MTNIDEEIIHSIKKLEEINDKRSKEYAKELEELGILYHKKDDIEKTIETLAESLEIHATIGAGYKTLMGIYNSKRAEAAKNGDMNEINKWMDKMDGMRNIAKKGTILR